MTVPTPASTYRIQFERSNTSLDTAADLVDHLASLGVTHLYASPLTAARPGSTHGYDVVDSTRIDPELGGEQALERLARRLSEHSMGMVLDIVPNHMAIGRHNPWWIDVLANGPKSEYWDHFDIRTPVGPIILPVLGRPYAETLAEGELSLVVDGHAVAVAYWDERFPLSPLSIDEMHDEADVSPGAEDVSRLERLAHSITRDPDRMHQLLDDQHYRLAWWQLSRERLDHRRFFTITDLIGIRQERRSVFDATHGLVLDLVRRGIVDGLRVDHIDGLRDPQAYLARLSEDSGGVYVVVEKILAPGESLPEQWPIAGTTGYEYLEVSAKAFVDPGGHAALRSHYDGFAAAPTDFARLVYDQQRFIIIERLGAETARFTSELAELARNDRVARDALSSDLIGLAIDVIASLPVYRTYGAAGRMSDEDRRRVDEAMELARARGGDRAERVQRFIERLLKLEHGADHDVGERADREEFVERLQQFTGAVMAKGVEDTAFYQYNVLLSLNEVGGHPTPVPADPVGEYHDHNLRMAATFPHTMTTASTHDTKRSEDVRSRISALTQFADEWVARLGAWHVRNRIHRLSGAAGVAPTNNEELFVYQTLIGSWPLEGDDHYAERIVAHLIKAAREAKVHTEWLDPDEDHERALEAFARGVLADEDFVTELGDFGDPVWRAGALDSLAQTVLRLTAPGVPDIYQGAELWDLSLTDPDNRRLVDWQRRRHAVSELAAGSPTMEEMADRWEDGSIKLHVLRSALRRRRDWPDVFLDGDYLPLAVEGGRAEHVIAFARHREGRWVLAIAPRLTAPFVDTGLWARQGWEDTQVVLPEGAPAEWVEELSGRVLRADREIALGDIFSATPVAIVRSDHATDIHQPEEH